MIGRGVLRPGAVALVLPILCLSIVRTIPSLLHYQYITWRRRKARRRCCELTCRDGRLRELKTLTQSSSRPNNKHSQTNPDPKRSGADICTQNTHRIAASHSPPNAILPLPPHQQQARETPIIYRIQALPRYHTRYDRHPKAHRFCSATGCFIPTRLLSPRGSSRKVICRM